MKQILIIAFYISNSISKSMSTIMKTFHAGNPTAPLSAIPKKRWICIVRRSTGTEKDPTKKQFIHVRIPAAKVLSVIRQFCEDTLIRTKIEFILVVTVNTEILRNAGSLSIWIFTLTLKNSSVTSVPARFITIMTWRITSQDRTKQKELILSALIVGFLRQLIRASKSTGRPVKSVSNIHEYSNN